MNKGTFKPDYGYSLKNSVVDFPGSNKVENVPYSEGVRLSYNLQSQYEDRPARLRGILMGMLDALPPEQHRFIKEYLGT